MRICLYIWDVLHSGLKSGDILGKLFRQRFLRQFVLGREQGRFTYMNTMST
jgi:hypothetical protein